MAFVSQEYTGRLPFRKNGTFRKTITLRGRIPGGGKRPLLFCTLSLPPGVQPRKGAKMREEKLLSYLKGACTGRRYSASSAALEAAIGISGTDLRKLVNRMRRKGVPIGSDRCGYFYAATAGEVYSTIQQLQNMENGLAAARRGLERSLDAFPLKEGAS